MYPSEFLSRCCSRMVQQQQCHCIPSVLHTLHDALPLLLVDAAFHSKLATICGKYELCVLVGIGVSIFLFSSHFALAQQTVLLLKALHTPGRAGTRCATVHACGNLHSTQFSRKINKSLNRKPADRTTTNSCYPFRTSRKRKH
jgi:hypothetical protein